MKRFLILIFISSLTLYISAQDIVLRKHQGSSLAATISLGKGFELVDAFYQSENGKTLKIGAGGGLTLGFRYNLDLLKNIELEIGAHYRNTYLNDDVADAIGYFRAFFFQLGGNYKTAISPDYNFKIGGGVNYNVPMFLNLDNTSLVDNSNELPKDDYKYKYNNHFGFHLQTEFEYLFTEDVSIGMGFQYLNTSFEVKSGKKTSYSKDPVNEGEFIANTIDINLDDLHNVDEVIDHEQYRKLDGQGINLTISIGYRF